MKPLNIRFNHETPKLITELAEKHSQTMSKVARDAMQIGLGVMDSNGKYISPDEFLKKQVK